MNSEQFENGVLNKVAARKKRNAIIAGGSSLLMLAFLTFFTSTTIQQNALDNYWANYAFETPLIEIDEEFDEFAYAYSGEDLSEIEDLSILLEDFATDELLEMLDENDLLENFWAQI